MVEYAFKPTVKFVIQKLLSSKPEENYYCEIEIKETGNISLAFYHRIQRKEHDLVDRFCSITNRYMIIEHQSIPIITEYDRKFAHLGWTIGFDF